MASKAVGLLTFNFGANMQGFERAMNKAQKKLNKFSRNIQKTGRNMTTSLTLPLAALGVASVKAFDKQQKAIAQVEAGLKSTGHAANRTSQELQNMAADLQKKTIFGDEEILQFATAQLLTFTNIAGEQFDRTQVMALDLATRLDGDLKSASIMLGKALNDPVANLSALSRAGIQFSEEQKETIKDLAETNRLAEAQTMILEELERQYGGSAEAAALAGMGPIQQLQNQLSDLSEQIGARLIPYVKQFVEWVTKLAERFDRLSDGQKDMIVKFGLILAAIGPVLMIIGQMALGVSGLIGAFKALTMFLSANPYVLLAAAIAAVTYAVYDLVTALNAQADVQGELADINASAQKSIITDVNNIDRLTKAYADAGDNIEEQKNILAELQRTYPGYYDEIDETTMSVEGLTKSSDNLKASLLDLAMIDAYKTRIDQVSAAIVDVKTQMEMGTTDFSLNALFALGGPLTNALGTFTGLKSKIQEKINTNELENLNQVLEVLEENLKELEKTTPRIQTKGSNVPTRTPKGTSNDTSELEELSLIIPDLTQNTMELSDGISNLGNSLQLAEADMSSFNDRAKKLEETQKLLNAGTEMFGEILVNSLNSALDSQESFFKVFVDNVKRAIRQLLIQLAVMTLIQAIMGKGKAAFTIANMKGNLASIMNVQLAEGGIVTSPTAALIGEAGPEAVIPLDKLNGMMESGSSNKIEVVGRLVGNDIYLSNAKTRTNRFRTV